MADTHVRKLTPQWGSWEFSVSSKRPFKIPIPFPIIPQEAGGVLVSKVERGGLAHSEGIQEGDLITEVNRQPVRTVTQFSETLGKIKSGQTVLLRIIRKAKAFFIVLKTQ